MGETPEQEGAVDARGAGRKLNYERLFAASANALMVLDREFRYVAVNDAYVHATATRREDLIGKNLFDLFPNDPNDPENPSRRLLRESLTRVFRTGKPDALPLIRYRVPVHTENGIELKERSWSATHSPVFDDDGRVAFIMQHTVDIAARDTTIPREQIEQTILSRAELVQQANLRLLRLFEQAPGFVAFLSGPNHVFELANAAYRRLVGGRDIEGKPVREALPEIAGQGFFELLDDVYTTGKTVTGTDMRVMLDEGGGPRERYVDFIYQRILGTDGSVSGILVQGVDVTERKAMEKEREERLEELRRRAEFEQQLIGIVSHDLRNPLAAILIGTGALLRREEVDQRTAKTAARIQSSAERATRLVRDLLDFTQIRLGGGLPLKPEKVELGALTRGVVDELQMSHPDRDLRVEANGEAAGIWDRDRLGQVISNLVTNAVKYSAEDKPVTISTRADGGDAQLCVHNDGAPIPQDLLPRLFQPMQRGVNDRGEQGRSVGLGLFIVRHIVEAHGGTVAVSSSASGGTTFTVRLPREA